MEAKLISLYFGEPPKGFTTWLLWLFADKMIELKDVETISQVTVENVLKTWTQALEREGLDNPTRKGQWLKQAHFINSKIKQKIDAWQKHLTNNKSKINWQFTKKEVRVKLKRPYPWIYDLHNSRTLFKPRCLASRSLSIRLHFSPLAFEIYFSCAC